MSNLKLKAHYILASFDIVNLYTNIPVNKNIQFLKENLVKNSLLNKDDILVYELITLTKTVLKLNYFKFLK